MTIYPAECLAGTPRDLARAAVNVSLAHVRKVRQFLKEAKKGSDCVEEMADELRRTMSALRQLSRRGGDFRWEMSNAETWVSAALTYEDTCLDGFDEIDGNVRSDVRKKLTDVATVTSNALYLINLLHE
ncbi:hypothetical protein SASPL_129699 [Salvia splendens]|uniref:Pectinesterase inhibitor domain-containing protein n=1 Tax=Salvia splendens TaxID=180675 RepID=A0A8X8XHN0_SALSN|nr:hypothetical protein SASPL_129699 [Salvia splendens]